MNRFSPLPLVASAALRLAERLRCDAATARARVRLLWRHEIFLALEVVTCLVAAIWGMKLLPASGDVFSSLPLYRAFTGSEQTWGAFYAALGLAGLYTTLTRGREARLMMSTFMLLSFLNLIMLQAQAGTASPAPYIYSLVGVVLPLFCGAWHLVNVWADEVHVAHTAARTHEPRADTPPTAAA